MYKTLMDPPYEFVPKVWSPLMLTALQFEHPEPLTCTETSLADVPSHMLLLLVKALLLKLQAYAPMCNTLMDPPYEFAPKEATPLVIKALQFEHAESLTSTETSLADVASHMLLLLTEVAKLKAKLQA
jgi:hypothetical protein